MNETTLLLTPSDHGQRMSLKDFADAQGQPGYRYELSRGVIDVMDISSLPHGLVIANLSKQLWVYAGSNPGIVCYIATGDSCKLLLPGMESERHPELAIYLTPPPKVEPVWHYWIPEITIEVVSAGQEERDYVDKRHEYLVAGVREYWLIDPAWDKFIVLRRKGDQWEELTMSLSGDYCPPLLFGLKLNLSEILKAYRGAGQ